MTQSIAKNLSVDICDYLADASVVNAIIGLLNEEISHFVTLRNLQREFEKKVIDFDNIKFSELSAESRTEVYVYLGRSLESIILCVLADKFPAKRDNTSFGDISISVESNGAKIHVIWEIKGTSGKNSWTGSTHASKKEDDKINFIGVKYGINENVNVFDLLDGTETLVKELFIGVFADLSFIRRGSATKSNSRTSLLISVDDYDKVKEQVAWGNFRIPNRNGKYLQFEPAA